MGLVAPFNQTLGLVPNIVFLFIAGNIGTRHTVSWYGGHMESLVATSENLYRPVPFERSGKHIQMLVDIIMDLNGLNWTDEFHCFIS